MRWPLALVGGMRWWENSGRGNWRDGSDNGVKEVLVGRAFHCHKAGNLNSFAKSPIHTMYEEFTVIMKPKCSFLRIVLTSSKCRELIEQYS
jgi:hypothetical protein